MKICDIEFSIPNCNENPLFIFLSLVVINRMTLKTSVQLLLQMDTFYWQTDLILL